MTDKNEDRDFIGEVIAEDAERRKGIAYKPLGNMVQQSRAHGGTFVPVKDYDELRQQLADVSHERDLLRSAQGWIDINDKLPREHEDCLVYYHEPSKFFSSLYYITQSSYYNDRFEIDQRVTHWMPLPAAPSAEVKS